MSSFVAKKLRGLANGLRNRLLDNAGKLGFSREYLFLLTTKHGHSGLSRFFETVETVLDRMSNHEIDTLSYTWDTIPKEDVQLQRERLQASHGQAPKDSSTSPLFVELGANINIEMAQKNVEALTHGWICHEGRFQPVPFDWKPFKTRKAVERALQEKTYRRVATPDKIILVKTDPRGTQFPVDCLDKVRIDGGKPLDVPSA